MLIDTGKPRKTCVEVAGRRTFRVLTAVTKSQGNKSNHGHETAQLYTLLSAVTLRRRGRGLSRGGGILGGGVTNSSVYNGFQRRHVCLPVLNSLYINRDVVPASSSPAFRKLVNGLAGM